MSEHEPEMLSPTLMVEQATPETAVAVADTLNRMLLDPSMPEPMREDTRARLSDLMRRFEEQLLDIPSPLDRPNIVV